MLDCAPVFTVPSMVLPFTRPLYSALPALNELAQIEWDDSQVFERNRPILIMLATALGLSSEQLDDLFITAAGL